MSQIEITCIDQTSIFTNTPEIFSGDVNVDTVKFNFDDSWDDYIIKTAVFYNDVKEVYTQELNESYVAVIPKEVMTKKCKLSIGVFGTNVNGDVKTSKILTYNIGKGAISDDLGTNPPTLDVWVQLLTRIIVFEDEMTKRQNTFESDVSKSQNTFENNITQQQNAFENTMSTRQNTFESNMESEFNSVTNEVDTLEGIVKGRNQALAYNSYSEMITALNSMSTDELKRGQNIYIGTVGVPDLWVYGVEETNVEYTYVDDESIVDTLDTNTTIQVGYYTLAQLETQKVDLTNIESEIDALESDVTDLTDRVVEIETNGGGSGSTPEEGETEWELVEETTGNNRITLPNDWEEILIVSALYPSKNITFSKVLYKDELDFMGSNGVMLVGEQLGSDSRCIWTVTPTYVTLNSMTSGGTNATPSEVTLRLYYKKKSPITVNVGTESNWALWGEYTDCDGGNYKALPTDWEEIKLVAIKNVSSSGNINVETINKETFEEMKTITGSTNYITLECKSVSFFIRPNYNDVVLSTSGYIVQIYYKKKCDNVLDVNDLGEWKLHSHVTTTENISLPESWKELMVITKCTKSADEGLVKINVIFNEIEHHLKTSSTAITHYIDASYGNFSGRWIFRNDGKYMTINSFNKGSTAMLTTNNINMGYINTYIYYR